MHLFSTSGQTNQNINVTSKFKKNVCNLYFYNSKYMKKRKKRNSYLCYVIYEGPQLCTLLGEIWGLKKSLKKSCQCAKNARDSLLERRYWTELPKTKRRFSDLVSKSRAFRPLLCRQSDQIGPFLL